MESNRGIVFLVVFCLILAVVGITYVVGSSEPAEAERAEAVSQHASRPRKPPERTARCSQAAARCCPWF